MSNDKKDKYPDFWEFFYKPWKVIKELKKRNLLIWVVFIIYIIVVNGAKFMQSLEYWGTHFTSTSMTDEELKLEAQLLSQEILYFLKERKLNEPSINFENWDKSVEELLAYHVETMQLYNTNFASDVVILHEEFIKRNIIDEEFEIFYEHPINQLGIEVIALRLAAMSTYL